MWRLGVTSKRRGEWRHRAPDRRPPLPACAFRPAATSVLTGGHDAVRVGFRGGPGSLTGGHGTRTGGHCSAVQCSAVQCSAVQCSAVQSSAVQCSYIYIYIYVHPQVTEKQRCKTPPAPVVPSARDGRGNRVSGPDGSRDGRSASASPMRPRPSRLPPGPAGNFFPAAYELRPWYGRRRWPARGGAAGGRPEGRARARRTV